MESLVQTRSWESPAWEKLVTHAEATKNLHLRDLLKNKARSDHFFLDSQGILLDYSRQRIVPETMDLLLDLANTSKLKAKINLENYIGKHVCTRNAKCAELILQPEMSVPSRKSS